MRDRQQELALEPVAPEGQALGVAGRTEVAALAAEGKQELGPAVAATHPREARLEQAAIEKLLDHLTDHRSPWTVAVLEALLAARDELCEVILNEPVERRGLGTARPVDTGAGSGQTGARGPRLAAIAPVGAHSAIECRSGPRLAIGPPCRE